MDITGLDKAGLLAALFNAARNTIPQTEHLHLTIEQARSLVASRAPDLTFGVVYGRRLHIDLSGDVLSTTAYNRWNGALQAELALKDALWLPASTAIDSTLLDKLEHDHDIARGTRVSGACVGR